jgi:ABC-type lipoprotein release transport system permease subunit
MLREFFDLNAVMCEIRVDDVNRAEQIAKDLYQRRLSFPYLTEDWSRLWPNLFTALQLGKPFTFLSFC